MKTKVYDKEILLNDVFQMRDNTKRVVLAKARINGAVVIKWEAIRKSESGTTLESYFRKMIKKKAWND